MKCICKVKEEIKLSERDQEIAKLKAELEKLKKQNDKKTSSNKEDNNKLGNLE